MKTELENLREEGSLLDKIRYIMANQKQESWSAVEMAEALAKKDLLGWCTWLDVRDVLQENENDFFYKKN